MLEMMVEKGSLLDTQFSYERDSLPTSAGKLWYEDLEDIDVLTVKQRKLNLGRRRETSEV